LDAAGLKRWRYVGASPADVPSLGRGVSPGEIVEAPPRWNPDPENWESVDAETPEPRKPSTE
jgi:hypothetical protein